MNKRPSGFTLIEVMIVVAVVAILAAIAVPAYNEQIRKGKRNDAMQALMAAAEAVERYKAANLSYTDASLGSTGVFAAQVPVDGGTATHNLTITNVTATSYTLNAAPVNSMANDCTLRITQAGVKSYVAGSKCSTVRNW